MAVVKIFDLENSSRSDSRSEEVNPPNPFDIGVEMMNPCRIEESEIVSSVCKRMG